MDVLWLSHSLSGRVVVVKLVLFCGVLAIFKNDCSSCLVDGPSIFFIASTLLGSAFTPSGMYIFLKKLQDLDLTM